MIKLLVEDYCQDCPEFSVTADISRGEVLDPFTRDTDIICNTVVTCEHRERCAQIKKQIDKSRAVDQFKL